MCSDSASLIPLSPAPQVTILWCKECGRYLQPPKHWVSAELESKELLTFCIKKIKGLQKVGWCTGMHLHTLSIVRVTGLQAHGLAHGVGGMDVGGWGFEE